MIGDKILRAKHWVIFLIPFGMALIGYILWIARFIQKIQEQVLTKEQPDPAMIFTDIFSIFYWIIPGAIVLLLWQWYVASDLQKYIPNDLRLNLGTFRICYFINILIGVGGVIGMQYMFKQMVPMMVEQPQNTFVMQERMSEFGTSYLLLMLFQIISLVSTIYVYYIIAKSIKTAELQSKVKVGDVLPEILWILFFPIGIWILQPRINKLVEPTGEDNSITNLLVEE